MREARIKKIARLMHSLKNELDVLESAQQIQFESAAALKDKLTASKRARSALTKARRISELISDSLIDHEK